MPRYDFRTPRLFVGARLAAGGEVLLDREQANYLLNVLRLGRGDEVLLFNGRGQASAYGNADGPGAVLRLQSTADFSYAAVDVR